MIETLLDVIDDNRFIFSFINLFLNANRYQKFVLIHNWHFTLEKFNLCSMNFFCK